MVEQNDLEDIVQGIASDIFAQFYPDAGSWNIEKQTEEAMATLELVGTIINLFMARLNEKFELAIEEAGSGKEETPKIFIP